MELLKERILKDGIVKPGNVLKVDSFLNHQMDIPFINELGKEFKRIFADAPINKAHKSTAVGQKIINDQHMIFRSQVLL